MKTIRITEEVHGKWLIWPIKNLKCHLKVKNAQNVKRQELECIELYISLMNQKKRLKLSILVLEKIFIKNWIEVILIISIKNVVSIFSSNCCLQ